MRLAALYLYVLENNLCYTVLSELTIELVLTGSYNLMKSKSNRIMNKYKIYFRWATFGLSNRKSISVPLCDNSVSLCVKKTLWFAAIRTFMFFLCPLHLSAQYTISGTILDNNQKPLPDTEVYLIQNATTYTTDKKGKFTISNLPADTYELIIFKTGYETITELVELKGIIEYPLGVKQLIIKLEKLEIELSAVVVTEQREELFNLKRLKAVEGTAIYAGKKTEVVLLENLTINAAANNARQIYSQIAGLNIYEANDAGLQLNIGGRGLDPNRTASFNTRQNGYDISADVLGYPESYYSPPAEALKEIQVIRGAASLQYGTQFGGLVNFVFKEPNPTKKIELISRQTIGSNNLFTSFNSLSGTLGKFSYYTYFNYKKGDDFRPNSEFNSSNVFAHFKYQFSTQTSLLVEVTYLDYLAQQAGGLTDAQFYNNPNFSNRTRNWFNVDWLLYAAKLEHKFSPQTDLSVQFFGLDAARKAVGFRTNRVSQTDDLSAPRDLLIGEFNNWGVETRLLHRYTLAGKNAIFLIGNKVYQSNNTAIQSAGTNGLDADFSVANEQFPFYPNQSNFTFPNRNLAFFAEHIFYVNDQLSITPGVRFENIKTESAGTFRKIDTDLAGNPIRDTTFTDDRIFDRNRLLLGLGLSFKPKPTAELYINASQNYRSVTFNDIRVVNPSFQVDPNISDENGFTADIGVRGRMKKLNYDLSSFTLLYNDRLGEVLRAEIRPNAEGDPIETGRIVRFRGNIGQAFIYGLETLLDYSIITPSIEGNRPLSLNVFTNFALTKSKYLQSEIAGVEGNEVEFIPFVNLKTGLGFGYKNLRGSLQYTYLSKQFTDASNAPQDIRDNQSGIVGEIPAYQIMDFSLSYQWKVLKLEAGINNVLDSSYFTRRATGYPGPGIIPSAPRTGYITLQVRL